MSYRWIENPARWRLGKWGLGKGFVVLAGTVGAVGALAVGVRVLDGAQGRFAPIVVAAAAEANNFNPRREACHAKEGTASPSCVFGGQDWRVIALGDSHVVATVSALASAQRLLIGPGQS